jgi:folate-dependent phosphoribosylglycinamide formyltransferase PurN
VNPPKVAILVSGSGSNAAALLDFWVNGAVQTVGIWTNRKSAGIWNRPLDVPVHHFVPGQDDEPLLAQWRAEGVTALVLAGYLKPVPAAWIQAFGAHCYNIHPALLPAYGGHGMYGHRVTEHYDEGPVLFQMRTAINPGDTAEEVAARILKGEHWAYPRVVTADLLGTEFPTELPEGWSK